MSQPYWFNQLPTDWKAVRLRRTASVMASNVDKKSYDDGVPVRLCNYTNVYYNDFITNDVSYMEATATPSETTRFSLQVNDVVITKDSESWDDIAVAACVTESLDNVVCGYHLSILRPLKEKLDGRFLFRAIQSTGIREQFWIAANGVTRFGLGQHGIKEVAIPLPPISTQRAIADYLDDKTAAIDALIEKKRKLLDLLAEERTALINQAVTKGLDPTVPLKDSGIPWIGEIPAHWNTIRLKHLAGNPPNHGIQMGPFGASLKNLSTEPTGFAVFGQANIISGNFEKVSRWLSQNQFTNLSHYKLNKGDVVLTRKGSLGKARLSPKTNHPGIIDSDTIRVRCSEEKLSRAYLSKLLHSASYIKNQITTNRRGAILAGLNTSVVENLIILSPPIPEQREITSRLDAFTNDQEKTRSALKKQINRLKEYRQALITAAVTGQLDIEAVA